MNTPANMPSTKTNAKSSSGCHLRAPILPTGEIRLAADPDCFSGSAKQNPWLPALISLTANEGRPSEHELVERCRQGDETAFRELVDQYKGLVFALIARSITNRARAEELAQDVFLKVHKGLPYFRGESKLSTWIYRIVDQRAVAGAPGAGERVAR